MARFYKEIDKDIFLQKVKEMYENEEFPYELPKIIEKDLGKVQFDWENFTPFEPEVGDDYGFSTYPVGYSELSPGFHVFFCNAGGDWEYPICLVFYWGDNRLRAYIPKDGNAWNKKFKCAYGSEMEVDETFDIENPYPDGFNADDEVDEVKMIEEIKNHITLSPK